MLEKEKQDKVETPRNPEQVINIPESKAPVFKAGKSLKEVVNAGPKEEEIRLGSLRLPLSISGCGVYFSVGLFFYLCHITGRKYAFR